MPKETSNEGNESNESNEGGTEGFRRKLESGSTGPAGETRPSNQDSGAGSNKDDGEDDGDDGEESDEDSAEVKALKRKLKRANQQAAKLRHESTQQQQQQATVDDLQRELHMRDAVEALREEGVTGNSRRLRRIARMLDSVKPGELESAIDDLKEDDPSLFKPASKRDDDDDDDGDDEPPRRRKRRTPRTGPAGGDRRQSTTERNDSLSPTTRALFRSAGLRY